MMKKTRNSLKKIFRKNGFLISGIMMSFVLAAALFCSSTLFLVKDVSDMRPVKVTIPENVSAREIAGILKSSSVIDNEPSFYVSSLIMGAAQKLQAGTYYLSPDMTMMSIILELSKGNAESGRIKLVIPEGSSIYRISKIIEDYGISTDRDFYFFERDFSDDFAEEFPFLKDVPTRSLEGYLFPDTYYVNEKMSVSDLAKLMLKRFGQVVLPVWKSSGIKKYSLHQIMTMASIIEKEAENDEERAIISSVFYNRLENGIALRADPTVKFALANPTKKVKFSDLKVDSEYNTYLYKGLPPGPICNPGLKSIIAAMYPAKTDYFYFVSNGDGTHTFSKTWDEHLKAAQKFRNRK